MPSSGFLEASAEAASGCCSSCLQLASEREQGGKRCLGWHQQERATLHEGLAQSQEGKKEIHILGVILKFWRTCGLVPLGNFGCNKIRMIADQIRLFGKYQKTGKGTWPIHPCEFTYQQFCSFVNHLPVLFFHVWIYRGNIVTSQLLPVGATALDND